jgi:hypothetical protein
MRTGRAEMSWSKNVFCYVMWFLYTLLTGIALAGVGGVLCGRAGVQTYWGILFAILILAVTGGIAWLFRRFGAVLSLWGKKRPGGTFALECVLAAGLLILGGLFRIWGMEGAAGGEEYYEIAKVVAGGEIPQIVHGAVYFYVQLLHGAFRLLGNRYIVGIWLQIVLQLAGSLGLFLTVRKKCGAVTALVTLGFCMCGPYMIGRALVLSPEILYFVLIAAAAAVTVSGYQDRLLPVAFLFIGILAALCAYLDVAGWLLLPAAVFVIFAGCREENPSGKRAAAILLCVVGAVLGMMICIFTDAFFSGKSFQGVVKAWLLLYKPDGFGLPASVGGADSWTESFLLFTGMAFGVFSFWYDREKEHISVYTVLIIAVALASCFGIFTEEMPGFYALYLLLALSAGQGIGQCFWGKAAAKVQEEGMPLGAVAEEQDSLQILDMDGEDSGKLQTGGTESERNPVRYLENPLPLPKKHVKRVMDYPLKEEAIGDDFDYPIAENDDFDI